MPNPVRKAIGSVLTTLLLLTLAHSAHALPLLTLIPTQTTADSAAAR